MVRLAHALLAVGLTAAVPGVICLALSALHVRTNMAFTRRPFAKRDDYSPLGWRLHVCGAVLGGIGWLSVVSAVILNAVE